jgi:phospholipid/cholesterol/gamma-HCH transport system ATP-binding protein
LTRPVILELEAARAEGGTAPREGLNLAVSAGDFALVELAHTRAGSEFADLCMGLVPLVGGSVRFLGRDWATTPTQHADALRGHIGRLFHRPLRVDTPDVAACVLLARKHHTRIEEATLREEAAELALHFGLPGLPAGPARQLSDADLLRAACVRAFLGQPRLVILELPGAIQHDDLLPALLSIGADLRGRGAAVIWLAGAGPALRNQLVEPTQRLRLGDAGLAPSRRLERIA